MFSSISWLEFIEFVLAVLFFYYAIVLLLCYRIEMSRIMTKFTSLQKDELLPGKTADTDATAENIKPNTSYSLTSLQVQEDQDATSISDLDISNIYVELEEAVVLAKEKRHTRNELLTSLQFIVRKCTNCGDTNLSNTINHQIQSHLAIHSLDVLNSQELSQIWSN